MSAVWLFWDTNMAAMISCENTQYWTKTVPSRILVSSFKFLNVKSLKEFSSLEQYHWYVKGFQRFHAGVKLRYSACLSLQFLHFEHLHYDYNTRFVLKTKKWHNSTSAFDDKTYLQAAWAPSETQRYQELLVCPVKGQALNLVLLQRPKETRK